MDDEEFAPKPQPKPPEPPPPRRRPKKLVIPRRAPSVVVPPRPIHFPTADKTTCLACICFPKEDPYVKHKKINPCQKNPLSLYELAGKAVDGLHFPAAFGWSVEETADWMANEVGLPQYRECIMDNLINGKRLLMLEDPSHCPMINIHSFDHIKIITKKVRELFTTEFVLFCRSINLPPRKPLTHCTWFKSRTGPTWGIRQNWDRCDILRWMKIIESGPSKLDHWDLVWYMTPDFPKTLFGAIRPRIPSEPIPHYVPVKKEPCREYQLPRKFIIQKDIPAEQQMIWLEHRPGSPAATTPVEKPKIKEKPKKRVLPIPKPTRLDPKPVDTTGLLGPALLLARRSQPKKKFMCLKDFHLTRMKPPRPIIIK